MSRFFNKKTEEEIKAVLARFMDDVLKRRLEDEPWDYEDYELKLPFHVALVPEEVWKSAKFERSFVTSLGMIGWEDIARIIAKDKRGVAKRGEAVSGKIYQDRLNKIHEILRDLERSVRKPDWSTEISEVRSISSDDMVEISVVADLYVEDSKTGEKLCFEIKSPKPNSDQTKVSKQKMLEWLNLEQPTIKAAYFALPFNPYGSKENYNHPHPFRWFNMREDEVVLMGESFWDMLGGEGTYEALIAIFEEIGEAYKNRIRKEYLGIE